MLGGGADVRELERTAARRGAVTARLPLSEPSEYKYCVTPLLRYSQLM